MTFVTWRSLKMKMKNKLTKENDTLRTSINDMLSLSMMSDDIETVWVLINELIENELDQEERCNHNEVGKD